MEKLLPFFDHPNPSDVFGMGVWEVIIHFPPNEYRGFLTDVEEVAYGLYAHLQLFGKVVLARWEPNNPPIVIAHNVE